jgi:hypothetical protein
MVIGKMVSLIISFATKKYYEQYKASHLLNGIIVSESER